MPKNYIWSEKECVSCGQPFKVTQQNIHIAKYCSHKCRDSFRFGEKIGCGLPTATVGAIGELKVSCDLLCRGYEVFRSVSPSCSCDLAVLKDGKLTTVEVRTGYRDRINGRITCAKKNIRADVLALVIRDEIIYRPDVFPNPIPKQLCPQDKNNPLHLRNTPAKLHP